MEQVENAAPPVNPALAVGAAIAAWLVPGLGHLLLRRWQKALIYFASVAMLAIFGLMMRGNVFTFGDGDIFDRLGFFAELGSGIFYFLAHTINPHGADISRAAGDYGTRMFATAGVLNLLFVLEAYQIGMGRESVRPNLV
jgi:hypothetical protein